MNNIKNYGPFQLWVLNNFPFTIDDWDSITQYQMLCKCLGALKEQLDVNSDLYQKISDLDNYVKNLDLQDEVNNKIDEMAESGQLQEIITEYLQINGVLAFNTVSEMINATNIIDGSVCKTLGLNTYNDGKGEFYKIRTITSGDTVDGVNIIALNISNTLIAEKIPNYFITNLQNQINDIEDLIDNIDIKPTIFIGDSYANIYTNSWPQQVATKLGLTIGTNAWVSAMGGAGFVGNNITFLSLIQNLENTISASDKLKVKRIVVCGGLNDGIHDQTLANITGRMQEFATYCKTTYPNAKIYVGFIGWNGADNPANRTNTLQIAYLSYCQAPRYGMTLLSGVEYIMHQYSLYGAFNGGSGDWSHPSETGMEYLSAGIYNAIINGSYRFTSQITSARLQDQTAGFYLWTQILDNQLCLGVTSTNFVSSWYSSLGTPSIGSQTITLPKVKEGHMIRKVSTNQSVFSLPLTVTYTDNNVITYNATVEIDDDRQLIVKFNNQYAHAISNIHFEKVMLNLNALEY